MDGPSNQLDLYTSPNNYQFFYASYISTQHTKPMNGENWPLVTNEPVEFEKSPVEVQDFGIIIDRFRGIYIPQIDIDNWKVSTHNPLDLETLGSLNY